MCMLYSQHNALTGAYAPVNASSRIKYIKPRHVVTGAEKLTHQGIVGRAFICKRANRDTGSRGGTLSDAACHWWTEGRQATLVLLYGRFNICTSISAHLEICTANTPTYLETTSKRQRKRILRYYFYRQIRSALPEKIDYPNNTTLPRRYANGALTFIVG